MNNEYIIYLDVGTKGIVLIIPILDMVLVESFIKVMCILSSKKKLINKAHQLKIYE